MLTLALAAVALGDGVLTTFVPSGAVAKAGGYRPIRSVMVPDKPKSVKAVPSVVGPARYGTFKFGDYEVGYLLAGDSLYVDSNRDEDYTNDGKARYESQREGALWVGSAMVDIGKGQPVAVNYYHFNGADPQRAALKDTMLYYGDFGYEVTLTLDGKENKSFVAGEFDETTSIWVDRNGDKRPSYNYEMVGVGKPFNFTGTSYVLKVVKAGLALEKSPEAVEKTPMAPNLTTGQKTLTFKAKSMAGKDVNFPSTYKGKIVLLDFWATWCGPCLAEMPNVVKAYETYHKKGFEILGVSFDDVDADAKIKATSTQYKMSWDHIYEGKGWETALGKQFDVSAIPFTLLVDGSTGKILGSGNELRGEGLEKILAKVLGAN